MRKYISFILFVLVLSISGCASQSSVFGETGLKVRNQLPQYLIGYGSLMSEKSRKREVKNIVRVRPVIVKGFQRSWIAHGGPINSKMTFLGTKIKKNSWFNGVLFKVKNQKEMAEFDKRESIYRRVLLRPSQLKMLDGKPAPHGQVWVYVYMYKPKYPDKKWPITQSYVDLFIGGCLEIQNQFHLKSFAKSCITSTSDWSNHWVNDRIYPRRPFIYVPLSGEIDKLLHKHLPKLYANIQIE